MMRPRRVRCLVAAILAAVIEMAASLVMSPASIAASPTTIRLPPIGVGFDYQLGGAYPPESDVGVVVRDRSDRPVPRLYNVCYINGFQTQPDELGVWYPKHRDLILRDGYGNPILDRSWTDEQLLNIASPKKRAAIAAVIAPWIRTCADDGYDAIEFDNLDSYTRSRGKLHMADAIAMARLLVAEAHRRGLAVAQKNTVEVVALRRSIGFDFAIAEECGRYDECAAYAEGYGRRVYVVEYDDDSFDIVCRRFPSLPAVKRDQYLVTPGTSGYQRRTCTSPAKAKVG